MFMKKKSKEYKIQDKHNLL